MVHNEKRLTISTVLCNRKLDRNPGLPRNDVVISGSDVVKAGSLPAKLPIRILFPENFISPKVAPCNLRGSSWG